MTNIIILIKHVSEGNIKGKRIREKRRKQLPYDSVKKTRYWNFKDKALDRIRWRTRFGRIYGRVASKNKLKNKLYVNFEVRDYYTKQRNFQSFLFARDSNVATSRVNIFGQWTKSDRPDTTDGAVPLTASKKSLDKETPFRTEVTVRTSLLEIQLFVVLLSITVSWTIPYPSTKLSLTPEICVISIWLLYVY